MKIDRYTLIVGQLLVLLHDARAGLGDPRPDAGRGAVDRARAADPDPRRRLHLLANIGGEDAHFVNLPTEPYHHEAPDRILLPWDTDELPVDVRHYLPRF